MALNDWRDALAPARAAVPDGGDALVGAEHVVGLEVDGALEKRSEGTQGFALVGDNHAVFGTPGELAPWIRAVAPARFGSPWPEAPLPAPGLEPEPDWRALAQALHVAAGEGGFPRTATFVRAATQLRSRLSSAREHLTLRREAQGFVRLETLLGPVLEAVPLVDGRFDLQALRARVVALRALLDAPVREVDGPLPWVLAPQVAGPLFAALESLLGAEGALAKAAGRKLFPAALSVSARAAPGAHDDFGALATPWHPVAQGVVQPFEPKALGTVVSTGTQVARVPNGPLTVSPGHAGPRPERHLWLDTRLETFVSHVRPGVVELIACGWLMESGRAVGRVGPFDFTLKVLETLRHVQSVEADSTVLPQCAGVVTPTLVLAPAALTAASGGRTGRVV